MKVAALALGSMLASVGSGHCACPTALTSKPNDVAKSLAISKLSRFLVCSQDDPNNDLSPCNTFAGQGLDAIYSVKDFKTATGYLSANAIWDFVHASTNWASLGNVFNEENNYCAQAMANQGVPVIAVMKHAGHGHIALVIPGEPTKSATWNMNAAFSASFLYMHPEKAYIGGPLSRAYQPADAANAEFLYRKPD